MTNAAVFEHMWMSLSRAMIFFTRDTAIVSPVLVEVMGKLTR
jgi:hypothetical protein